MDLEIEGCTLHCVVTVKRRPWETIEQGAFDAAPPGHRLMVTWARKRENATAEDAMSDHERDEEPQPLALRTNNLSRITVSLDHAMLGSSSERGGGGQQAQVHAVGQMRVLDPPRKGSYSRCDGAAAHGCGRTREAPPGSLTTPPLGGGSQSPHGKWARGRCALPPLGWRRRRRAIPTRVTWYTVPMASRGPMTDAFSSLDANATTVGHPDSIGDSPRTNGSPATHTAADYGR